MMRPSIVLLGLLATAFMLSLLAAFQVLPEGAGRIAAGVALGVVILDFVLARSVRVPAASRRVRGTLPVNRVSEVELTIRTELPRGAIVSVDDTTTAGLERLGLPVQLRIAAAGDHRVTYRVRPLSRGEHGFGEVYMTLTSPLRLWQRIVRAGAPERVRVYPDFAVIAGYLALASDRRTARVGIKISPRRGEGLEFHQLREYRQSDSVRQVDWKATARRRRLISREYHEERDQQVLFLLDSGRRMRSRDGELSHFDHALNAMLLLAYVALRQGDEVSALAFGANRRWIPHLRGVGALSRLLNGVYDVHSGPQAADYIGVAEEAMTRHRKRSLIVLMTNVGEEDHDLAAALRLLRRRHVVLLANLREAALDAALNEPVEDLDAALNYGGALYHLARRRAMTQALRAQVHLLIDARPAELPTRVVNGYWQIKRSGTL
jgi:uncharacterized protein (DUF58 family)